MKKIYSYTLNCIAILVFCYFISLFLEKKHDDLGLYGGITIILLLVFGIYKKTIEDDDTFIEKKIRDSIVIMMFWYCICPAVKESQFTDFLQLNVKEIYLYNVVLGLLYATGLSYLFDIALYQIGIMFSSKFRKNFYAFIFAIYGVFEVIFKALKDSKGFKASVKNINLKGIKFFTDTNSVFTENQLELFTTVLLILVTLYFSVIISHRVEKEKEQNKNNQINTI